MRCLEAVLGKIGYLDRDDGFQSLVRTFALKWACHFGNLLCKKRAHIALMEDLQHFHINLPERRNIWKGEIYCAGMMTANITLWQTMLDKYRETADRKILGYLTCFEDYDIINRFLLLNAQNDHLIVENKEIYRTILQKHAWRDDVFDNILKHFDKLKPKKLSTIRALCYLAESVYSKVQHRKIRTFLLDYYVNDTERYMYSNFIEHIIVKQEESVKKYIKTFTL